MYLYLRGASPYCRYTADNARTNPCVADTMVDTVPDFLRSRPKWFIKHCLEQMTKAKEWEDCELYEEGVFLFKVIDKIVLNFTL